MLPLLAAFDDPDRPVPEQNDDLPGGEPPVPPEEPEADLVAPERAEAAGAFRPTPRREPPAANEAPSQRPVLQRLALALLLIAAAALIGYVLSRPSTDAADPDAIARSVAAAGELQFVLDTDDAREAQRFVRDQFGWRVGLPVFGEASLRGVAVARVAPSVEVPVFLYEDRNDREVAVFAYSYALLDQIPDRLRLAPTDYDDLIGGDPVLRRAKSTDVLLWRDRDDIYIAVTDIPPDDLRGELTMVR